MMNKFSKAAIFVFIGIFGAALVYNNLKTKDQNNKKNEVKMSDIYSQITINHNDTVYYSDTINFIEKLDSNDFRNKLYCNDINFKKIEINGRILYELTSVFPDDYKSKEIVNGKEYVSASYLDTLNINGKRYIRIR